MMGGYVKLGLEIRVKPLFFEMQSHFIGLKLN